MTIATAPVSPAEAALRNGTVTIDVVSDVVCPWCYIGKRRLEAALATSDQPVEIHWRPFQLDPTIPANGLDRRDYLTKKFGNLKKVDTIHRRLTETGREVGIAFDFSRIERAPNTLDAHRLIRWAASAGVQGNVVEGLFCAYFVEARDIGHPTVLADIAETGGMDRTLVHRLLVSGADSDDVRAEITTAVRLGVSGVPFFIFAGKYAVPGAQSADVLSAAIAKARQVESAMVDA